MTQVGDYINEWVRCPHLEGPAGESQHLLFGVVAAMCGEIPLLSPDTPTACGIPVGPLPWYTDDDVPKCERCRQIAEGDRPSKREHVPTPREREVIPA